MFCIPVLTYHALHAPGNDYSTNDHISLEQDLALIRAERFTIVPLLTVVEYLLNGSNDWLSEGRYVALSFDDGTDHDYFDFSYPGITTLKSFYTLLLEHKSAVDSNQKHLVNATSFVIASPEARIMLDHTCIAGRKQWQDTWWQDAHASSVLNIANHSWDHCHPNLEVIAQQDQRKGSFLGIETFDDAKRQILDAEHFIRSKLTAPTGGLFAYPYGEWNDFLVQEFFPSNIAAFSAAFSTAGDYVTKDTNRWCIPRFVCGEHWQTSEQLVQILRGSIVKN